MDKIDEAILMLVGMIRTNMKCDDALKFTQACLNLAHTKAQLEAVKPKPKGA